MADVIGVYVRQAGVWERANAGLPEGFSGPQIRDPTKWQLSEVVYGRAAGSWETTWVNVNGEIQLDGPVFDTFNVQSDDFSFGFPPSYSVDAGFRFRATGEVDSGASPGSPAFYTKIYDWRLFDCGREYEIRFEGGGPDGPATTQPPLNTWLNFTDPATTRIIRAIQSDSGPGAEFVSFQYIYVVRLREKVGGGGGQVQANFQIDLVVDGL